MQDCRNFIIVRTASFTVQTFKHITSQQSVCVYKPVVFIPTKTTQAVISG